MTEPQRTDLPLPDYDHLPIGSLGHRIRSLDEGQLETLLRYEREHGDRLAVVQVLEARLQAVRDGAPLSGGSPSAASPETAPAPEAPQTVTPQTAGPVINPPSHGDPTNPAQPRSTG